MDAYQPEYIPFYLATKEFFELTRDRLSGNGLFILNIDQPADNDELEKVLGRTMSEAFPNIRRRAVSSTTTLLLGSKSDIDPQRMRDSAEELDLPTELLNLATPTAVDLGPRLEGGEVFTDDKAPVEWLVDLSQY
jgi:spermidine synthase